MTTRGVHLPDFGGPRGALLLRLLDYDELRAAAGGTDYYRSWLGPSYERYRQVLFVDTLNDWGWFGPPELRPSWFTGAAWE